MENSMKVIIGSLLAIFAFAVAKPAAAQTWPARPLTAVVPVGAGSLADTIARLVLHRLASQLGQPVIVENRTGAGGTIGAAFVAKSPADGYTLLVHSNAHTIAPALYPTLSYHPARDFAAIAPFGISPHVLVVSPSKGFKTVGDLITAGKAKPGSLTFASVGVGSATHLSAERFRASAGIAAVHVPFRGGPQAVTEVMAGRVDFFFGPLGLVLPQILDGKLIALAVNGYARSAALPAVPTTAETGLPNAEFPIWFGMFAPAQTPRLIIDKLHDQTIEAVRVPDVADKLAHLAIDPMTMTTDQFAAFVAKEVAADAVLKTAGIKAQAD
jgi:tripartite-type tricarboxylate transporter receptor subunit TctC